MFHKVYTLNRVRDHITVKEGSDTIDLTVDSDANLLMGKLNEAQKKLSAITAESTEKEKEEATIFLSQAMFGVDQTAELLKFYGHDYNCVIAICGMYFSDKKNGLAKKITKAQKKRK